MPNSEDRRRWEEYIRTHPSKIPAEQGIHNDILALPEDERERQWNEQSYEMRKHMLERIGLTPIDPVPPRQKEPHPPTRSAVWGGGTLGLIVGLILSLILHNWFVLVWAILAGVAFGMAANLLSMLANAAYRRRSN